VDGKFIKFNYGRYRWRATTPNTAKNSMLDFDNPKRHHLVKPHRYTVNAVRGTKITPFTRERQDQVNEARRVRIAEGRRDKDYGRRTTHQRVIGMAAGYG
jgi:hypothetical protein